MAVRCNDPPKDFGYVCTVMVGHGFCICVNYELDHGDMTLDQGYDTNGQKLCETSSRPDKSVRNYH